MVWTLYPVRVSIASLRLFIGALFCLLYGTTVLRNRDNGGLDVDLCIHVFLGWFVMFCLRYDNEKKHRQAWFWQRHSERLAMAWCVIRHASQDQRRATHDADTQAVLWKRWKH